MVRNIQDLASSIAFSIARSPLRPGRVEMNRAFLESIAERDAFENLPPDRQNNAILERIREVVRQARRDVPYYRVLLKDFPDDFPQTLDEYRQIPPLSKEIIRNHGAELVAAPHSMDRLHQSRTGGSTGEPIRVYLSDKDQGIREGGIERNLRLLGGGSATRLGTLYGGELDVQRKPSGAERVKVWLENISQHGCFRLDAATFQQAHLDFEAFQPDLLLAYASAMAGLAEFLQRKGIQPTYPARAILTAAERLEPHQRRQIEEVFSCPVVERYGSRDLGLMAYQLPGESCMRVDRWYCLLEPEGTPDAGGSAPLLVTTLRSGAMPLLRYQIGDIARFAQSWKPATAADRLLEITGRQLDFIHLPNGRRIHSSEFPHLFKDYPVQQYQVIQDADGAVSVQILPQKEFCASHLEEIRRLVEENLAGTPVTIQLVDTLQRTAQNKLRPVISHYKPSEGKP